MDYEEYANEDEFNDKNSQDLYSLNDKSINNNNINNEQNNINNNDDNKEINNSNNKEFSSEKEKIEKESEEKALLLEINNLEKEKEQFYQKRKEQNDTLEKYMNLLKSLQIKNEVELNNISVEDTNFELGELIKYNTMLNAIESEERILEEEKIYFEKYKSSFNRIFEDRQKDVEDLRINYEKEKEELDKRREILEMEEKMINDKYNNFEFEKKIITERYNNAMKKEAELIQSKMRIENSMNELDRRNLIIEKNSQFINDTKKELEYQILKNMNEEKRILDEKSNIKLRQEMVDSLRMKYVEDATNSPFELMSKTFNKNEGRIKNINFGENTNDFKNSFSTINQKDFNKFLYNEKENDKYDNKINYYDMNIKKYESYMNNKNNVDNNKKKLSIIEEDKKISENSQSINQN